MNALSPETVDRNGYDDSGIRLKSTIKAGFFSLGVGSGMIFTHLQPG